MSDLLVTGRGLALPGRLSLTDIDLHAGQVCCLVGPNGSGKTSLLHALAGIGKPAGTVVIDGTDVAGLPPSLRQQLLAFLPASHEVAWPIPAADLIALGGGDASGIAAALQALELDALASRRIDRLSTGERSRILIARALAARPRLLLLDEPASNLDPLWQLRLMDLLRRYAGTERQAVMAAVHDLDLARHYADRLIVMANGRIVADGQAAEVLDGPVVTQVFGVVRRDGRWIQAG